MEDEKQIKVMTLDGERLLSEGETRRYRNLLKIQTDLEAEGYTRKDKLISLKKANTVGNLVILPLVVIVVVLYIVVNGLNFLPKACMAQFGKLSPIWMFVSLFAAVVFTVVHELIHGFFWAFGARNGWKDVEFGFVAKMLTPYCTCMSPIKKPIYVVGAMMPMLILGVVTGVVAIVTGIPFLLPFAVVHIFGGAGDILITGMILKEDLKGKDVLIFDHPYDCGFVLFEKK